MNFQDLYRKIADLDKPVAEAKVEECGMDMPGASPMGMPAEKSTQPPSMSLNINAQGMDDIESLMKLITKVNPDMDSGDNLPVPIGVSAEPMDAPVGMHPPMSDIMKAVSDRDGPENDGVDIDGVDIAHDGEEDGEADGDEDEGAIGAAVGSAIGGAAGAELGPVGAQVGSTVGGEIGDKVTGGEEETEAWANSPEGGAEPEIKDTEYMTRTMSGGMNGEKEMKKHSYKQGDNPYAMDEAGLRAQIRADLMQRLEESKAELVDSEKSKRAKKVLAKKVLAKESFGIEEAGQKVMVIGYNSGREYPLEKAVQDPKSKREVKNPEITMDQYSGAPVLKFYELDGDGPYTAEWHPKYGWTADFD